MAGNRANVIRAVTQTLEGYTPLRNYLKHKVGATSLAAGARIVGDNARIDDLPVPLLVLSIAGGATARPGETSTWQLAAIAYATDIYQVATILDHLEMLADDWVRNPAVDQPLNRFRVTDHEGLDAVGPAGRLIAVRINLEVSWIS